MDPFEEEEDHDGGDSDDVLDMGDKSLGPPFGIVLNGHSLVSSLICLLHL